MSGTQTHSCYGDATKAEKESDLLSQDPHQVHVRHGQLDNLRTLLHLCLESAHFLGVGLNDRAVFLPQAVQPQIEIY